MLKKHQDSPSGKFLNFKFIKEENAIFYFEIIFPPETASPLNLVQGGIVRRFGTNTTLYQGTDYES